MKKLMFFTLLATSVSLLVFGCSSDKGSDAACRHQATMDLDHGNYEAVLASSCANGMQKGAAYFAKAGYDINDVINSFIDANETNAEPLDIYMSTLSDRVDGDTLTNLGKAADSYFSFATQSTTTGSAEYKDAKFNESLVGAIKGISFLKLFITVEGSSALAKTCDWNGNGLADSQDAAVCALKISADPTHQTSVCPSEAFDITPVPNLKLESSATSTLTPGSGTAYQDTYVGYRIKVKTPPVTPHTPTKLFCPNDTNTYERLFSTNYDVVATTNSICVQTSPSGSATWPCPVEEGGTAVNLADTFDEALNGAIWALSQSFGPTSSQTNDVRDSIEKIKKDNCCTPPEVWNPGIPASCTCTSDELSVYLSNL